MTGPPDAPEPMGAREPGTSGREPGGTFAEPGRVSGSPGGTGCSVRELDDPAAITPELVAAFARLIPQLSSSSPPPGADELCDIAGAAATTLLVAEDGAGRLLGTLTLAVFRVPTGVRAWIEDVVVDEHARGQGAGEALVRAAIDRAGAAGARSVDLTSRPARVSAHRLYRRLGFEERQTSVYRQTGYTDGGGPGAAT